MLIDTTLLTDLQQTLCYKFNKIDLLIEALSHPSLASKIRNKNYERLEFLGDAILSFIIGEFLFKNFSSFNEGRLAKIRAFLVSKDTICNIASKIGIQKYIIMTQGEEKSMGRINKNNIENCMEALLAAVYIDSDIQTTRRLILSLWEDTISNLSDKINDFDPKSTLQELCQSKKMSLPHYNVVKISGPDHLATFDIELRIDNLTFQGCGSNKKNAEKSAAKSALNYFLTTKLS